MKQRPEGIEDQGALGQGCLVARGPRGVTENRKM